MEHKKSRNFGLIGKNIEYSFSRKYFFNKFSEEVYSNCTYQNFDLVTIDQFSVLLHDQPDLKGLNVTIPYKEAVIPYLDKLSKNAALIGAVNVIKFTNNGKLKGYNSDFYGFKKSLKTVLQPNHKKALILGTGGAAKAVAYALNLLGIYSIFVSRSADNEKAISYDRINETTFDNFQIIVLYTFRHKPKHR